MDSTGSSRLVHATVANSDNSLMVMELVLPSVPLVGSIVTIYAEDLQRYKVLDVMQSECGAGTVHVSLEPV